MAIENDTVELLSREIQATGVRITAMVTTGSTLAAVGGAGVGVAGLALANSGAWWVLMIAPLALGVLLGFVLLISLESESLGGYRAALEERINRLVGSPVVLWESTLAKAGWIRFAPSVAFSFLLFALYSGACIAAIVIAINTTWLDLVIVEVSVCGALVAGAFVSVLLGYRRAYRSASNALERVSAVK